MLRIFDLTNLVSLSYRFPLWAVRIELQLALGNPIAGLGGMDWLSLGLRFLIPSTTRPVVGGSCVIMTVKRSKGVAFALF
jgi:hypothetical protein